MIFFIDPKDYPAPNVTIEEVQYTDQNGFSWLVARIVDGTVIHYTGDKYFSDKFLEVECAHGFIRVKNTGCIFVKDISFGVFYELREILKSGYTDEIWDAFSQIFSTRLSIDPTLTPPEIYG